MGWVISATHRPLYPRERPGTQSSTLILTSALDWGEWSTPPPGGSAPRERPGIHCTGGWVGPRAGLDGCGKFRPSPGFDPRTVQLVASRYTD